MVSIRFNIKDICLGLRAERCLYSGHDWEPADGDTSNKNLDGRETKHYLTTVITTVYKLNIIPMLSINWRKSEILEKKELTPCQ